MPTTSGCARGTGPGSRAAGRRPTRPWPNRPPAERGPSGGHDRDRVGGEDGGEGGGPDLADPGQRQGELALNRQGGLGPTGDPAQTVQPHVVLGGKGGEGLDRPLRSRDQDAAGALGEERDERVGVARELDRR